MLRFYAASLISKQVSDRESEIVRGLTRNSMHTAGVNEGEGTGVIIKSLQLGERRILGRGIGKKKILLVFSARRVRAHRPQGEKRVEDALIDQIQFGLQRVEEFVQPAPDDLFHVRVG